MPRPDERRMMLTPIIRIERRIMQPSVSSKVGFSRLRFEEVTFVLVVENWVTSIDIVSVVVALVVE